MKILLTRFIKNLIFYTAAVGAVSLLVYVANNQLLTRFWGWLLLLFFVITFSIYYLLIQNKEKKFNRFANYFMIASMLKILLLLIIIGVFAFSNPHDAVKFTITLLAYYILFLFFEVYWLLRLNRKEE